MGLRHYESFFMEFRMYWIVNHSLDPTFNLALEEYFLGRIEPGHPGYAILWQNSPAIVVGRFQNTRQEVNADFVRERGISVVRRMTGGGAVYHDATIPSSIIWTRKEPCPPSAKPENPSPRRCKSSGCP
jgi:lipoate-protein ligase A